MLAGLAQDLLEPGSVCPVTVGSVPVILVTGADGVIRGFQNVCRHRGAQLLGEPCHGRKILTCRYHRWSYDLEGRLL